MKEEQRLTTQLLGRSQAAGLQGELALHLPGQLLHEEGLLEAGRVGGVLWLLCQEGRVSKMAHFDSVGILMPCTKKDLNVDLMLTGTLSTCATYWNGLHFAPGTSGIKSPFVD